MPDTDKITRFNVSLVVDATDRTMPYVLEADIREALHPLGVYLHCLTIEIFHDNGTASAWAEVSLPSGLVKTPAETQKRAQELLDDAQAAKQKQLAELEEARKREVQAREALTEQRRKAQLKRPRQSGYGQKISW